jgi:uncharacterized LabA/DUF88 family protein
VAARSSPGGRAVVFIDGQNLFHAAREAFGYTYPNYDVRSLSRAICASNGWQWASTRFYTGIPDASDDAYWHRFWTRKLAVIGRQGVVVRSRRLRYRYRSFVLPDGSHQRFLVGEEKGIDVRLALDIVALAHRQTFDVALVISQDQDLAEVAEEIRVIAREQKRWIKIASAYPVSSATRNRRGINKTDWIPIGRDLYDRCLDQRDYRPSPG